MNKRVVLLANDTTYTYNLRLALIQELINKKYEIYIIAEILKFKDELESIGCHLINIDIGRHGTNPLSDIKLMKKYKKILKQIKPDYVLSYNIKPKIAIGKMSFIGPRPWIPDYYENMNEKQRTRCDVRPGLTGLAQVKGRNNITIFDKINYDLEYIKNYSLIQDIKIIFWTATAVLTGSGADAGKSTIKNELEQLKNNSK